MYLVSTFKKIMIVAKPGFLMCEPRKKLTN